jgi:hypothetical protein
LVLLENDFLKFLKIMIIKKPVENSKPASASKKNEILRIKSSFNTPIMTDKQYNIIHINSEYKRIYKIFVGFIKKKRRTNQKIKVI